MLSKREIIKIALIAVLVYSFTKLAVLLLLNLVLTALGVAIV